jgi:cell division protein FtsN
MSFGLGIGLIVALGVYLRAPAGARTVEPSAVAQAQTPRPAGSAKPAETRAAPLQTQTSGNRFEFYEILPQLEVAVPDDDAPARDAVRPRPTEAPGTFLLQAGSFNAAADADRLQANLALLGLESHVQRVKLDDEVFHRVRIGPIGDIDTAKRTQRRLRDAGIDPLLMQVPK